MIIIKIRRPRRSADQALANLKAARDAAIGGWRQVLTISP